MKTASSWQILDLTFKFRGLLLLAGSMWCMRGGVEGHSWAVRLAKGTRLWLMLVCRGDEPTTHHHEPCLKLMQCNVCMYTHWIHTRRLTPLHIFYFSEPRTSVLREEFPPPFKMHTFSPKCPSISSLLPTLIDSQNSPLPRPFLSLHPSILLNLHSLCLYFSASPPPALAAPPVVPCQRATLKRLLYFHLAVCRQWGAAFPMTQLKQN